MTLQTVSLSSHSHNVGYLDALPAPSGLVKHSDTRMPSSSRRQRRASRNRRGS